MDNVQMLAEAKAHNPGVKTILRHWYDKGQQPANTDGENEQLARIFFDSFIDGTFTDGETAGNNHAASVDFVEGWNEYFGNTQSVEEKTRFISWARAAAKVWATEYKTRAGLEHIRLILANTAIGNDIPLEVARASIEHDAVLGYHCYWPTRYNKVPPEEWSWYSGRWTRLDAAYREHGYRVTWAFTEAGAIGYHGDWPSIGLGPLDGWKKDDVHGRDIDEYLGSIARWMNLWHSWNKEHDGRALPPVLFTSGGTDEWRHFEVQQPHMDAIADFVKNWIPIEPTPEPPPVEPPPTEPPPEPDPDVVEVVTILPKGATLTQDIYIPDGFGHAVTVNLLPQDTTVEQKYSVVDLTDAAKEDILQSAHSAARLTSLGKEGSKVKVWGADHWADDIEAWLLDHGAPEVELYTFFDEGPVVFRLIDIVDELSSWDDGRQFPDRTLEDITALTIHHTVSGTTRDDITAINGFHQSSRGWERIGYHYCITSIGGIYQTNHLTTKSFHAGTKAVGDENLWSVGVALLGNFTFDPPPQVQQDAAKWLVEIIQDSLGDLEIYGHREMPEAQTQCPGNTYLDWISYIKDNNG
jgi:hypothetical protein